MDKVVKNFFKWLNEKDADDIYVGISDDEDTGYYADDCSYDGYEEDPDDDIDWDWYEQFYEDSDESSDIPEFIQGCSNVYRTKYYIVKQALSYANDRVFGTYLTSHDTFYLRTRERDEQFDELFRGNFYPNGRRIPTMAYDRIYVK
jgi:hypothetical protein